MVIFFDRIIKNFHEAAKNPRKPMKQSQIFCLRKSLKTTIVLMDMDWYMYQNIRYTQLWYTYFRIKRGIKEIGSILDERP